MIMKMQNDKARIAYIDFGNVADIDVKDLKEMPECYSLVLFNNTLRMLR